MKRSIILSLLLIIILPCLNAQKKEIAQARAFIKSGKNLAQAEKLMLTLLKDSANRNNEKVCVVLCDALRKQYEEGNMNMYLKKPTDTAALFNVAKRMFAAYEKLDSIDATPDDKGRVRLKYRYKNSSFLDGYRKNLYSGGAFFIRRQQYKTAFDFIDMYLNTVSQPLFRDMHYPEDPEAAYWGLYCGYKLQDPVMTLKYKDIALRDTVREESTMEYLAETYKLLKDTVMYEKMLTTGFYRFKRSAYFFTYLVDFYNSMKRPDLALGIINDGLSSKENSELYLFAKCNQLLNMGRYDDCLAICDTLIARNDTLADAYYNAGVAYINKAIELDKQYTKANPKLRKQVIAYYNMSLPYMEKHRVLAPDQKDKWGAALYKIYLELNMGKKFEEIDRLLR
ncbi:MAG: hypothetical protein IJ604_03510 [Prevotella sp.]|nr:hypothetical protein [Prevotella sp.]